MSSGSNKKKNINESPYELEDSGYFSPIYAALQLSCKSEKNTISTDGICDNCPENVLKSDEKCDYEFTPAFKHNSHSNEHVDILLKRRRGRRSILQKDSSPIKYLIFNDSDTDYVKSIDFLNELKPYPHIIRNIFRNLSILDLCRVCSVSKTWKTICYQHSSIRKRRLSFLQKRFEESINGKENSDKKHLASTLNSGRSFGNSQNVYVNQTVQPKPSTTKSSTSNFQMFVEEGKKLPQGGKLIKCPQCSSPSQILPEQQHGHCTKVNCNYNFCIRCLSKFLPSHVCISRGTCLKDGIGSKRSFKNLHRLTK